jgi:Zn ribbon nucleic-acid-binding protein
VWLGRHADGAFGNNPPIPHEHQRGEDERQHDERRHAVCPAAAKVDTMAEWHRENVDVREVCADHERRGAERGPAFQPCLCERGTDESMTDVVHGPNLFAEQ